MLFSLKPDYETSCERYAAFWEQEIVDRALVCFTFPVDNPKPVPSKTYAGHRERWTDVAFRAEQTAVNLSNRVYYADALPVAWPNMGPEIFSAWCGCGYRFGETTTWSEPCIESWERDAGRVRFDPNHELFALTDRFTDRLLELGKNRFIVGLTDFHPGGDHLAALRDPQELAVDTIENVEHLRRMLDQSVLEYKEAYDHFFNKLSAAGMPSTSWTPIISQGRYYIPSNDFSCMISNETFEDLFLPGIADECRFYERSIYHLDGPGALRHLDSLLALEDLDAIQWVPGAGNEGFARWLDVYKRIQLAGKSMQIVSIEIGELPLLFEHLRPEGVLISSVAGVHDREAADEVINRITKWR